MTPVARLYMLRHEHFSQRVKMHFFIENLFFTCLDKLGFDQVFEHGRLFQNRKFKTSEAGFPVFERDNFGNTLKMYYFFENPLLYS